MEPWQPVTGQLVTRWAAEINPASVWQQYPRPQLRRKEWQNLNGLWEYAITALSNEGFPDCGGQILVPFPIESSLSGVKRALMPDERLWYRRSFQISPTWHNRRVLLHFGAVDWETTVWINGALVGTHRGGFTPFTFDITEKLRLKGDEQQVANEIMVSVWDPTDSHWQQRGKQVHQPKSIWYTQVSGIWQTVWLEPVPDPYISGIKVIPDIDAGTIQIGVQISSLNEVAQKGLIQVIDDGVLVAERQFEQGGAAAIIPLVDPKLWSPDSPHLYDLVVEAGQDRVESYFGMRKFSQAEDSQGRLRICLNNKPLFQYGPLDQGYWPDGLFTPPSFDAMRFDLEMIKRLGCNMVRKHVKIEPACYYYECDRLGLIVWQDLPNGGKAVGDFISLLAVLFRFGRRDRNYRRAWREQAESRDDFYAELQAMIDSLHHFTSIAVWVPFNEGWGQFDAKKVSEWLKVKDPTRLVDHASGWFDQGGGDFRSLHVYFKKLPRDKPEKHRSLVLSEFGGYSFKVAGHTWDLKSEFGYRKFHTTQALTNAYVDLLENQLIPWIGEGLSAAIYTQAVDVEIEENGFITYDREVEKMDFKRLQDLHRRLF